MSKNVSWRVQYLPCDEVFEAQQFISVLRVLLVVLVGKERLIQMIHQKSISWLFHPITLSKHAKNDPIFWHWLVFEADSLWYLEWWKQQPQEMLLLVDTMWILVNSSREINLAVKQSLKHRYHFKGVRHHREAHLLKFYKHTHNESEHV